MPTSRQGYAFVLSLLLHGAALGAASRAIASVGPAGTAMADDGSRADGPAGLVGDTFDVETLLAGQGSGDAMAAPAGVAAATDATRAAVEPPDPDPSSLTMRRDKSAATPEPPEPRARPRHRARSKARHRDKPRPAHKTPPAPPPLAPPRPAEATAAVPPTPSADATNPFAAAPTPNQSPANEPPSSAAAAAAATPHPRGDAAGAPTSAGPGEPSTGGDPAAHGEQPTGGQFGAAGAPRGAVQLAATFVHELPQAVAADRAWSKLPEGEIGSVDIALEIDADGKVRLAKVGDAPAAMKRIASRTLPLLRSGVFMLSLAPGRVGREVLRVSVTLSQHEPLDHPNARPTDAFKLGSQPPAPSGPGRAYFTLASGRHFEATVTIVSSVPSGDTAK